ncbi:MAG: aldo/keto reductase [Candidatus Hermodarchaeota archaeon]
MKISKITLGTAQLGLEYGIANAIGKPDFATSIKILTYAWNKGINSFDTAPVYGDSENIIGSFALNRNIDPFIITKLPAINTKQEISFESIYNQIKQHVKISLSNLKINKIPIYLVHNTSDMFIKHGLVFECLNQIKQEGLIEKYGISAYTPEEVKESLTFKEIDVIQVPINLFDQRLIISNLLKTLKNHNYIVLARSIYLQGLFFLDPNNLPLNMNMAEIPLKKLRALAKEYDTKISEMAFSFVRDLPEITSLVIGAENLEQIDENVKLLKTKPLNSQLCERITEEFSALPDYLINPSLWNPQFK